MKLKSIFAFKLLGRSFICHKDVDSGSITLSIFKSLK